jgi:hypothetical protein
VARCPAATAFLDFDSAVVSFSGTDFLLDVLAFGVATAVWPRAAFVGIVLAGAALPRDALGVAEPTDTCSTASMDFMRGLAASFGLPVVCRERLVATAFAAAPGLLARVFKSVLLLLLRSVVPFAFCAVDSGGVAAARRVSLLCVGLVAAGREACLTEVGRSAARFTVAAGCCGMLATAEFVTALDGCARRVAVVAIEYSFTSIMESLN